VSMREQCKNFQSRTYSSGDVARFCVLGLAPEAPWKCPEECSSYEPRLADVAWVHGSVVPPAVEAPPPTAGSQEALEMLRDAEEIVGGEASRAVKPKGRGLFGGLRKRRDS
jgi:hypothetical protein